MRIHGYCHKCRKIKRVTVTGSSLARAGVTGVAIGICGPCLEPAPKGGDNRVR